MNADTPNQQPWLIIPVEVQHREFLSRLLIAERAVERGYRVLFGRDTVIRRMAPFLPRGILLDKDLGSVRHGKARRFSRLGYRFSVFDEEATGYYGSPERFLSVRLAGKALDHCHLYFCISETMREAAAAAYPGHAAKFAVSGLPRTDVWRPQMRDLYEKQTRAIREEIGPYLLFCSNFGTIIHARGDAFVEKQIRGQARQYDGITARHAEIAEEGRRNLEAYLEMLPELAARNPDRSLVVRPHPSESVEFWERALGGVPNIRVIARGTASPWILASDCLVHHGCTTGIEAELMGKPQIMYAPHPDSHHETEIMRCFAPMVREREALYEGVAEMLAGKLLRNRDIGSMEEWFAHLEGRLVSDHLLDGLDAIRFPGKPLSPYARLGWHSPRNLAARFKPRSKAEKTYAGQKWQGTSTTEIGENLAIMCRANRTTIPQLNEIVPELWQIG